MKDYVRQLLLKVVFAAFILVLLFYFIQVQTQTPLQQPEAKKQILAMETQKESPGFPVRLKIPEINVDSAIEYTGLASDGSMDVPKSPDNVAWFDLGPRPGEAGSAVMAGHFNRPDGGAGVFNNLYKLKEGDKLYVEDDKGVSTTFVVQEKRAYDPGYANDVFNRSDGVHLNLITCDGFWDEVKKSYSKRLVILADVES